MTAKEFLDQLPSTDWTTTQVSQAEQTLAAALQAYGDERVAQERKRCAAIVRNARELYFGSWGPDDEHFIPDEEEIAQAIEQGIEPNVEEDR